MPPPTTCGSKSAVPPRSVIGASFAGTIIASAGDTLNTGASLNVRVFALNGAATLDTNQITGVSAIPEPASLALVLSGIVSLGAMVIRGVAVRRTIKSL